MTGHAQTTSLNFFERLIPHDKSHSLSPELRVVASMIFLRVGACSSRAALVSFAGRKAFGKTPEVGTWPVKGAPSFNKSTAAASS